MLSTGPFAKKEKAERDRNGEKKRATKEDVCLNDFKVFQLPTEENRIGVTVGAF